MMNQLFNKAFHRYNSHIRSMSIDVHTHMYTPKYMDILKKRIDIPRVIMINNQARLVILPGEDKEITTSIGGVVIYMYISTHLSIISISHLSIYMHIILIYLITFHLSIHPLIHLSIYIHPHIHVFICLSTHSSLYLSIYLSISTHSPIYLSIRSAYWS